MSYPTDNRTWWSDLRWRLSIKLLKWAVRVSPEGDARHHLHMAIQRWCIECERQWKLRYGAT